MRRWLTVTLLVVGCADPSRDDGFTPGQSSSMSGESSGSADSAGDTAEPSEGSSGSGVGDDGPKLDVGSLTGIADDSGGGEGCKKVDFLFVIDNSASMIGEQKSLAASFPGFIETLQNELSAQDYHILVTSTDATVADGCEEMLCEGGPPLFPPPCPGYACGTQLSGCDSELGAGRILDAGYNACPGIDAEQRYLTDQHPTLYDTFSCVAQMGGGGYDYEEQMGAMLQALSPEQSAGGCNDSFLRDDAILVVTVITDEEAGSLHGGPQDWYAGLVQAKGGNEDAIVVLTLTGPRDEEQARADDCWDPLFHPKLHDFTDLFGDRGLNGSVCEADYAPFFAEAVGLIDTTCDEFIPEG